ncbi:MAG: hypothetical protein PHC32_01370 [Candidatus Izemoplasmatales bacterium]|nr:hypothetical protein [Candidatus Izemoplasmatales bacterium]MDD3864963.1 hypothetical protein [Candidatus Izemoplasmatales bacterium]
MIKQVAMKLSQRAGPSIAYRIKKEIFLEDINNNDMQELQNKIVNRVEIQRIFSLQKDDGWLGGLLHGVDEPECCIRYLIENGVDSSHHIIRAALNAIINKGDKFDEGCMYRVGKPLDEMHLGGSKLIRACIFAYAGKETHDFVLEQIEEALNVFRYVCNVNNISEVSSFYKDKLVFNKGTMWPCIYHLRLLAYTNSWKNSINQEMMVRAITKLVELSPIPNIKLLYKYQLISPASVYMNDFNNDMNNLKASEWMMWFHRVELITRLGIATKIPAINSQIIYLNSLLSENDGFFWKPIKHYYFTRWTQYIGLALEDNWHTTEKVINDLTFRSLLINYYLN